MGVFRNHKLKSEYNKAPKGGGGGGGGGGAGGFPKSLSVSISFFCVKNILINIKFLY